MKIVNNKVPNPENPINNNVILNLDQDVNIKYYKSRVLKQFDIVEIPYHINIYTKGYFSTIKYTIIKHKEKNIFIKIEFSRLDELEGKELLIISNSSIAVKFLNYLDNLKTSKQKDFMFYYLMYLCQFDSKIFLYDRYVKKSCFLKELKNEFVNL